MIFNREHRKWAKIYNPPPYYRQRVRNQISAGQILAVCLLLAIFLLLLTIGTAHAEETYTDAKIVNAIYKAEGGRKASKPYGIMLPKCSWDNVAYCKKACEQTVANNRIRYADYGYKEYPDYLSFLQSRYAPTVNATNDPKGLNRHWLKNVRYFLSKGE